MDNLTTLLWIIVALVLSPLVLLAFGAVCAWVQDFKVSSFITRFLA